LSRAVAEKSPLYLLDIDAERRQPAKPSGIEAYRMATQYVDAASNMVLAWF
jgi:hypothetical protein